MLSDCLVVGVVRCKDREGFCFGEDQEAMSKDDYLYEKDGSYNPRMVKKILKAMKSKPVAVFSGPTAGEDFMKWLKTPLKTRKRTEDKP